VPVAVGADVRVASVDVIEARHIGPDVLQPDREEQAPRLERAAVVEGELEALLVRPCDGRAYGVHQLNVAVASLVAPHAAKLRRLDLRMAEEAVDAARLPVARVAGIDEHDAVQVAREPNARAQPRRSAPDDGDVVHGIIRRDFGAAATARLTRSHSVLPA